MDAMDETSNMNEEVAPDAKGAEPSRQVGGAYHSPYPRYAWREIHVKRRVNNVEISSEYR
jgi:hypothetical protein